MNAFTLSITKIFKRAREAFQTFPVVIGSALAFAIVTMVRIQLDWPEQEAFNLLFNCLHWAFALGAIFGLAAITAAQSRYNTPKAFKIANFIGIVIVAIAFVVLYLFGGADPTIATTRVTRITDLASARVGVAILVSFLAFIVLARFPKEDSDLARSFFMTHKAFFIALIYGLVIMSGTMGVAGAIEALIYNDMSNKVYMYIGTISGFLAFTIFVGYFPDFRKGHLDEHRETAQKQPRFVEILFEFIMIPIALAMTAVLLIWAGKIVAIGDWPNFIRLSGIATAYAASGIWLHVMVTHYKSPLANFYRRIYPVAALIILSFEAWAIAVQLGKSGLKLTEYSFILVWIVAAAAAVLLIVMKAKAHQLIIGIVCIVAVVSVLPAVGYHALPVSAQVSRLENLLEGENMLEGGRLVPASEEPDRSVRESVTDAVNYLAYASDAKLPEWFDKRLREPDVFKSEMGFEQTRPERDDDYYGGRDGYLRTSLGLGPEVIEISDYQWAILAREGYRQGENAFEVEGKRGMYNVYWSADTPNRIPVLKILLDDQVIIEKDMNEYIDRITETYPPGEGKPAEADVEEMSYRLETAEVDVLLVFRNVEINVDPKEDRISYWMNLDAIYFMEK